MTFNKLEKIKIHFDSGQFVFAYSLLDKFTYFIIYLILARTLSQNEYGFIVTIFAFTNILQVVFDFGFPFYLQREAATKNNIKSKLNTALAFKLLTFIIYLIIPIVYFKSIPNSSAISGLFLIIIISIINYFVGINGMLNAALYGNLYYKQSFIALFISRIFLIIIFILLSLLKVQAEILFLIFFISLLFHFFLENKYLKKLKIPLNLKEFNWKELKEIFPSSIKIGLGLIFVLIYDRIDIIILQNYIGLESVAIYSIAYSLFRGLQIFSAPLFMPRYTNYSNTFSIKKYISFKEVKNTFFIILLLSVIMILFTFILAKPIILFLYSSKYFSSINILQWLSIALLGVFLNNYTGIISNSIRKEIIPLISTAICAVLNIVLNLILIPKYGIMGAVISTIITEYLVFFTQLIMLFFLNNKLAIIKK